MSNSTEPESKPKFIYVLREAGKFSIRYIGATDNPKSRYRAHLRDKSRCHRVNWIKSVLARGGRIEMSVIARVPSWAAWQDVEKRWIEHGIHSYWPLTNGTLGGDGVTGLSGESKERMARTWIGRKHTEETKRKISAAIKGRKHTEEYKEYMRKIMSVRVFTEEHRARLSAASSGVAKVNRKLTVDMAHEIVRRLKTGEKGVKLASEYGVNKRTIWLIKSGRWSPAAMKGNQ